MTKVPLSYAALYSLVGAAAVAGGAAYTYELIDSAAALRYLMVGGACVAAGFVGLCLLSRWSRRRALATPLFFSLAINVSLTPIMLAIGIPLIWQNGIFSLSGALLSGYFVALVIYQLWRTRGKFDECWEQHHEAVLATTYDARLSVIRLQPIAHKLQLGGPFFPDKLPFAKSVCVGIVLAVILALQLSPFYVDWEALLIGFPALTLAALIVQWSFHPVLLARKIGEMERTSGTTIGHMDGESIGKIDARARKAKRKAKSKFR